ncbi:MAG: choice-of-anchor A family protein [Candidatus Thiodiazotropha sp.]|jgi:choice-of-anchor A domain-containing protein
MQYSSKLLAGLLVIGGTNLASATAIENYNMILFGDFNVSGGSGHIHGTAFVGGDLNGQNPEFGANLSKSVTIDTLEVAGDLNTNQVTIQAGNLVYGGTNNLGNINCNGNGLSGGGCLKAASGLDAKAASLRAELSSESAYYAGLSANGSVDLAGNRLSYTGGATDLAIFNLNGSDLFAQNSNWDLEFGTADKVLINVYGDTVVNAGGVNFNGGFSHLNAEDILWNFVDASIIDLGSSHWFGSILAMNAVLDTDNDITGSLVADSYIGNGQMHMHHWNYQPPQNVPEPNITLLMMMGLGFLGLKHLRRI